MPGRSAPRGSGCAGPSTCSSAEDRLPVVRRMILADNPAEEAAALEELRLVQREDFVEILEAMDGLPVTVRLLDPPLHEFLPSTHEFASQGGHCRPQRRGATAVRGCPGLAGGEPDARDSRRAPRGPEARPVRDAGARAHGGSPRPCGRRGQPIVEIMIPLTVSREELALARSWVEDAVGPPGAPRRERSVADGERNGRRDNGRPAGGHDRHHDRDAPGGAAGRRDRRSGRLLLASAPTTSPR